MRMYRDTDEVERFLIHLFLLQTTGHLAVHATLWLFRLFGMPQPYILWHSLPNASHWLTTLLLAVSVTVSIRRILRKRKSS